MKGDDGRAVGETAGSDVWSCIGAAEVRAADPDGQSADNGIAKVTLVRAGSDDRSTAVPGVSVD